LQALSSAEHLAELIRELHTLAVSAGTFGLRQLGEAARAAENHLISCGRSLDGANAPSWIGFSTFSGTRLAPPERMARLLKLLLCGVAAVSFSASAASNDDGFVWIDANTKIKLTPIGKAAAGASAPEKDPKKDEKKEKPKK
jgi:chemotaxis protein histidine kinase CheA